MPQSDSRGWGKLTSPSFSLLHLSFSLHSDVLSCSMRMSRSSSSAAASVDSVTDVKNVPSAWTSRSSRSAAASGACMNQVTTGSRVLVSRCDPDQAECLKGFCSCNSERDEAVVVKHTKGDRTCDVRMLDTGEVHRLVHVQFLFQPEPLNTSTRTLLTHTPHIPSQHTHPTHPSHAHPSHAQPPHAPSQQASARSVSVPARATEHDGRKRQGTTIYKCAIDTYSFQSGCGHRHQGWHVEGAQGGRGCGRGVLRRRGGGEGGCPP